MDSPIAAASPMVKGALKTPNARENPKDFGLSLRNFCITKKIDFVIPTCEEVFFVAATKKALPSHTKVLAPELGLLRKLHSKIDIYGLTDASQIGIPDYEVKSSEQLIQGSSELKDWVLKTEFCRFGVGVKISPSLETVKKFCEEAENSRFIMQKKITGKEFCTYSFAIDGKLVAYSCYLPKYRLKDSASFYYEPYKNPRAETFVSNFVKRHNITGQISFDFIENNDDTYLIECNPRANSGVHNLDPTTFADALFGNNGELCAQTRNPHFLKPIMVYFIISNLIREQSWNIQWIRDMRRGKNVFSQGHREKIFSSQIKFLWELFRICRTKGVKFVEASTADIEWDGQAL